MNPTSVNISQNIGNVFDRVLGAGRTLWLAGVGAVAEVSEGGMDVFDRLVERGRTLEERQKKLVDTVTGRAGRTVREARQLLEDTVELESRGVLKRLNVMTRDDVKVLSARLQTLSKKVDEAVARRHAVPADVIEIVSPEGETAVVVPVKTIPVHSTATARPKASRPRPKKATR
ncbi:MAG TPA: phasin family protein [Thermoanaerobaculia bacterium]|jgi:poly(hydroxyalkanoate) granule-associated protein